MMTRILILAACFAIGGCSTLTDYGSVRKEGLRNDQGHVIGCSATATNPFGSVDALGGILSIPLRPAAGLGPTLGSRTCAPSSSTKEALTSTTVCWAPSTQRTSHSLGTSRRVPRQPAVTLAPLVARRFRHFRWRGSRGREVMECERLSVKRGCPRAAGVTMLHWCCIREGRR